MVEQCCLHKLHDGNSPAPTFASLLLLLLLLLLMPLLPPLPLLPLLPVLLPLT